MVAVYSTMYAFSVDSGNPQYKGPVNPDEAGLRSRFAQTGFVPGQRFDVNALSAEQKAAFCCRRRMGRS